MRRFAVPLVIVAGVGVLGGLVVMWRSLQGDSATVEVTSSKTTAPSGGAATHAPALPSMPTARSPSPSPIRPRTPESPGGGGGGEAAPALAEDSGAPGTRLNTKNLEWGLPQMRAQVAANEPKVVECLNLAAASGDKPTGDATLTFIAARKGDKIVIEDTAVDHDQSTLKSEPLLDCLHATSKAMTFEGLPREAAAVFITRTVKVENGGLVENKLIKFSYIR